MDTFTIDGKEYPFRAPAGKNGRRATAYLLSILGDDFLGSKGEDSPTKFVEAVSRLFMREDFEAHLPAILRVDPEVLEEGGDLGEILVAVLGQIDKIFSALNRGEAAAALKNLPAGQEGEGA